MIVAAAVRPPLLVLLALVAACDKVPLLAPTGSSITLSVSTTRVAVNGTAEIVATVVESAGTPPQNGTVVTFTSSLGTIEPREARTQNGSVTVRFTAGTQSGTARINAVSGGIQAEEALEIQVGGAAVASVSLRAEPASVSSTGGMVTVVATVLDDVGNRLAGIPVAFSTDGGQLSAGQATTDANGEARATLNTSRDTIVTVRAAGQTQTFTVRAIAVPAVTIAVNTTEPQAGIPVSFTVTPVAGTNANAIRNVTIDFGDGTTRNLGVIAGATPVTHTYARAGTYTVTGVTTDAQGQVERNSIVISVADRGSVPVTVTASPQTVSVASGGLVNFTATAGGGLGTGGSIQGYSWDFGDGQSTFTTGGSASNSYRTVGRYTVRVNVRAANGAEGVGQTTVLVTP